MRKIVFSLLFVLIFAASCAFEQKAAILLGSEPIDITNFQFMDRRPVFSVKQNIHFLLISKEPIENPKVRVQVLKLDKKGPAYGVSIAYAVDINRGADKHYVTDYFVLRKAGDYIIRMFSYDNMQKPIAETEFSVEDL